MNGRIQRGVTNNSPAAFKAKINFGILCSELGRIWTNIRSNKASNIFLKSENKTNFP